MLGHALLSVGGANGRLETGLHVDAGGAPVNRFHLTSPTAMGLTQAGIEKSGTPGFGEVATPIQTGDNSNAVITREQDQEQMTCASTRRAAHVNRRGSARSVLPTAA
jgi:hypothetical protein